ncbi:MAG: glycosyltransferase [Terriglobia bacterium]|jgi:UDP:flavonoid glycosyltransferase YjiC (YdhE family)
MKIGLQTWGSEGDIRPFTALAAGLVGAGHEVTLAVTDNMGRDYSEVASQYGFKLIAVPNPEIHDPAEVEAVWREIISAGNPIKQARMVMEYGFDPAMEAMYVAARELCATNNAVIGHFFVYPLRVAAEKAGVPIATLNVVHNCLPSAYICPPGLPDIGKWFYPLGWALVRKMINRIFLPRVNALRSREGLPPDRDVMTQTWASQRLNLIAVSPHICDLPKDWDKRHQVCGFLNPPLDTRIEELPVGLDEFLAAGESPVYMTFGSMMPNSLEYIRETADLWTAAIKQVGCRAIIQLPVDDLSIFDTDDRVFKVKRSPYVSVFPRCAAIVHHGGAGTTQSSLLAGRPSIVVAHMADQFFWGDELKRLGAGGKTLSRNGLSAGKLAKGIEKVLGDSGMAERAASLGQQIARENGVANAVRLIEETFTTGVLQGGMTP